MKISAAITALVFVAHGLPAQTTRRKPASPSSAVADRMGLTCPRILEMSSTDWVAKFNKERDSTPEGSTRALATYGSCYDARTDRLAATLAQKGASPSKRARDDFLRFETALKQFTVRALADAQPAPPAAKIAYVNLYEKQFRYEFHRAYAEKNRTASLTPGEEEEFGKAKNRFAELLGLLPEEKAHEVHEAFGEIIGTHDVGLRMKLALYRYTIFILEPPAETPFSPPPF